MAVSGNAHTRLYLIRNRTEVRRLPIRLWWFQDQLRVVRATAHASELLGCEILAIDGVDVAEATARTDGIKAGGASWRRYMSAYFLSSPDILFGAGVARSPDHVELTALCEGEAQKDIGLDALPLPLQRGSVEAWADLAPSHQDPSVPFRSALTEERAPLYLQRPDDNYWFDRLPSSGLYIQFNDAQEDPDGPSMADFTTQVLTEIGREPPPALVVDLRLNTGGNLQIGTPLMEGLAEAGAPAFVRTSRSTFSAGLTHAVQLKQWLDATIVGEPAGDELDYWSEGGTFTLPNSGLIVRYSNGFHGYSMLEYPGRSFFLDLNIETLAPDLPIEPSWDDYIAGRDPVLELVEAEVRGQ